MTEEAASGTARVLDPSFVEGLGELAVEEVRRRRDEALAEREYLSYVRRLIQVRMDILTADRDRRAQGLDPEPLVERISAVLAEGPQGRGRGEAIRLLPPPHLIAAAEERADRAMGGVFLARLETLDDESLERAIDGLAEEERRVSEDRAGVIRVHDLLQDELKRRYREDPSLIPVER